MTDFRALCAEGVAFIWSATDPDDLSINADEWAEKANAALIETDEELAKLFAEVYRSGKGERWRAYIRALLARWGNHLGSLDSSDGSAVPEPEDPTDEELFAVAEAYAEDNGLIGLHNAPDFARAVLNRYGNPTP